MSPVEGWKTQRLRNLATINYGKSPSKILAEDGLYPVVGTGGSERLCHAYLHDGDSIILGRKGTIDRVYFATGRFWTIDTAYYLSDFNGSVPIWLFYYLQTIDLRSMNEATGVPSLSRELLYQIEVPTPSKPEQTKIAEILSTVDRAIEQTEALIVKQQRIKTGLMQDLLTRGIDEHGNLRSEKTHKFKDSPLGRIPVEWEVVPLEELADAIDPQPDHRTPTEVPDGVPYIGVSDFKKDGRIDFDRARKVARSAYEKQKRAFTISEGDFVFGKIGTIGLPRRVPTSPRYALSANVIMLKPRESASFIYWWMASPIVERLVELDIHTTSQPAFGIQKMRSILILKPIKEERQRIGKLLDELELNDKSIGSNLSKLRSLKIALMQDLLTGKKRVHTLLNDKEGARV